MQAGQRDMACLSDKSAKTCSLHVMRVFLSRPAHQIARLVTSQHICAYCEYFLAQAKHSQLSKQHSWAAAPQSQLQSQLEAPAPVLQSAREQQDRFANSLRSSNDIDMSLVVSVQPNSEHYWSLYLWVWSYLPHANLPIALSLHTCSRSCSSCSSWPAVACVNGVPQVTSEIHCAGACQPQPAAAADGGRVRAHPQAAPKARRRLARRPGADAAPGAVQVRLSQPP